MKATFISTVAFLQLSAACLSSAWGTQCQTSHIKVDKFRVSNEGTITTSVFGVLLNACSEATGVQLKITFLDKAGEILRVEDVWPASTNNVPARTDFPFQMRFPRVEGYDKVDVRVINTKSW